MFLMATSAIGPGFITQTTQFTAQLGAAFAFAILVSIAGRRRAAAQRLARHRRVRACAPRNSATACCPASGHVLTFCVVLGGFVFNVGNVAGCRARARCAARARPEVGRGALGADRDRRVSLAARGRRDGPHRRRARLRHDRDDGLRRLRLAIRRSGSRCATPCCRTRSTSWRSRRSSAARSAATSPMPARIACSMPACRARASVAEISRASRARRAGHGPDAGAAVPGRARRGRRRA